jgi:hypothetical protein
VAELIIGEAVGLGRRAGINEVSYSKRGDVAARVGSSGQLRKRLVVTIAV